MLQETIPPMHAALHGTTALPFYCAVALRKPSARDYWQQLLCDFSSPEKLARSIQSCYTLLDYLIVIQDMELQERVIIHALQAQRYALRCYNYEAATAYASVVAYWLFQ